MDQRAGIFVQQPFGYKSFIPKPLPPNPPIDIQEKEMRVLLSEADRALGRLDGITHVIPNPNLFVAMYVKKEALLSAQIEGTQASFIDVLTTKHQDNSGVADVINYISAMEYGLKRLKELPISLRLIREIHTKLLATGRGSHSNPGEFRTTQNWIGPPGSDIMTSVFVPPSVPDMKNALNDLEKYIYEDDDLILIKIALIHAQFETIHPFSDGNGRIGRLLITFLLCQKNILSEPLLYISYYFKKNKTEYYDRLMDVRMKGDWEGWIKFFLRGIVDVSKEATSTSIAILDLKTKYEQQIFNDQRKSSAAKLLNYLFDMPIVTKKEIKEVFSISYPTASSLIDEFEERGILYDMNKDKHRYKVYAFQEYLYLLERGTEQ